MKNLFLTVVLIIAASSAFSQSDPKAIELLQTVSSKLSAYKSIQVEFRFYVESLQDGSRDQFSGKALYRGDRYRMDLMGQVVFSDGKTNWTYLKDAEEINITDASETDGTVFNPQNVLNNFSQDYKCRWISDKFENNRTLVEIDLYPVKIEGKKYSKLTLKVDKTKNQIYSIHYVGKDGVSYLVVIDKFVENPVIADKDIIFNSANFPNAEIIDMR
ncbi:MAG: outer membrane lipoprotein carrier protein LolA [Bacteroidales bacterium]|nr:outer membrane lipoprotein carrier protein LolA [Bacteroidales bacterium]HOY38559.1 outer membrane lipoprotein carrier protein LolA [Bacteroidales bacterium]HQP03541.1 outer membrane lipoprotein carrier protein LolA [Bacteroidales bacterium]